MTYSTGPGEEDQKDICSKSSVLLCHNNSRYNRNNKKCFLTGHSQTMLIYVYRYEVRLIHGMDVLSHRTKTVTKCTQKSERHKTECTETPDELFHKYKIYILDRNCLKSQ